jgi:methionyl aminopeptidase
MFIKTKREIKFIKEGGKLMGEILGKLQKLTKPGMSLYDVDVLAEKMILQVGGKPAFKGYKTHFSKTAFPSTICASVNTELVHGIARKDVILKDGDIFSIDIGMEWPKLNSKSKILNPKTKKEKDENISLRGYFTDTAITLAIGEIPEETKKLLAVTKEALEQGIKAAQPGKSIAEIGKAVEKYVRSQGQYGIVRDLVGHGVGHEVHEEPNIPNYYDPTLEAITLKPGMVIAIEPMLSLSKEWRVKTKADGWTIEMIDKSLCAHFEHTLVITEKGNVVVTRRPGEGREVFW